MPVAGLAVGLMVAASGPRAPAGHPGPGVQTARLTAAEVLDRAAASALARPTVVPRPGQFVYWKTVDSGHGIAETWHSVDGSRNGFVLSPR